MTKIIGKKILISFFLCLFAAAPFNGRLFAAAEELEIKAANAILIEESTGKVIYEKNLSGRVYPASMTKILTAVLLLEHIGMDEIIVTGREVYEIPSDSSRAGHMPGESISGINLLRGLLLPSGNETGCVVAAEVVRRVTGRDDIPYPEAEKQFADMLNEKAKSLGANNTHFVNPHGYHDNNHYTTAYDMALICKEAMKNETFAAVVKEGGYEGNGVTEGRTGDMNTSNYHWVNTNGLVDPASPFFYVDAEGIKTGFTGEAGHCLASAAARDGKSFIAVVFNDTEADRYEDSVRLFEYGFNNYDFRTVQEDGVIVDTVNVHNPKLGEESELIVKAVGSYEDFMSEEEILRIEREIIYDESALYVPAEEDLNGEEGNSENAESEESGEGEDQPPAASPAKEPVLIALPINEGDVIGKIIYTLDGKEIFTADLISSRTAYARTKETDFEYYRQYIMDRMFTVEALPFWAVGIFIIVFLLVTILLAVRAVVNRRRRKRGRYTINYRKRRY